MMIVSGGTYMFGERLRNARKSRKISQDELAKVIDVSKGTISNYENGVSFPNEEKLIKISERLNVSFDYLLGRIDDPDVTLEEYINKRSEEEDIIGLHFSKEELKSLSKEKIDSIIDFVNYQIESEKKKR